MASIYAPVERQERAPLFQSNLLPEMPVGTPLLPWGDWNCVAEDLALVGGQALASMASNQACCPSSRACRMPSGACVRKRGSSRIQLPTIHPQPKLTDGLSATASFFFFGVRERYHNLLLSVSAVSVTQYFLFLGRERYSLHQSKITISKTRDINCIP